MITQNRTPPHGAYPYGSYPSRPCEKQHAMMSHLRWMSANPSSSLCYSISNEHLHWQRIYALGLPGREGLLPDARECEASTASFTRDELAVGEDCLRVVTVWVEPESESMSESKSESEMLMTSESCLNLRLTMSLTSCVAMFSSTIPGMRDQEARRVPARMLLSLRE